MITVTIWHNDETPRTVPLREGESIIGRSAGCAIRLDSDAVSRKHARLIYANNKLLLSDLGSSNGTYIKERRIEEEGLRNGDTIRIADFLLTFRAIRSRAGESTKVLERPGTVSKSRSWFRFK